MSSEQSSDRLTPLRKAVVALKEMKARLEAVETARTEPLAIIGLGCRVPGPEGDCAGPDEFWQMLRSGGQAVGEVPPDRWDLGHYYDPDPEAEGKMATRWGGFLSRIDQFDPQFFGIAPREAASLDPQQRLLLEVSWEALEHAGQAPDRLHQIPTGMFVGIGIGDYGRMQMSSEEGINVYSGTGGGLCFASGRLSYFYRTQGPSLSVDTACSSSLVAVHLACQSLRNRECRLALAGGVNLMLAPEAMIFLSKSRALSPTGRCRTFDAGADGFVRGEGCGVLVLKRLSDALEDRDRILAVIRSSAVNHDGPSSGLTVPNGRAQQTLLRQALEQGGLEPKDVSYLEAHGTGTALGDPIELRALAEVYGADRAPDNPLNIGSVKTNMGHLEAAAGVSGIIKTVLGLQHRELAPHLHFQQPTPHFDWQAPLKVNTEVAPWTTPPGTKRVAGISSFGLSGTNAHVLVEEAPEVDPVRQVSDERPQHLFTLTAKSEESLKVLAQRMASHLESTTDTLPDVCFSANTGRAALPHRIAVTASAPDGLVSRLRDIAKGETPGDVLRGEVTESRAPRMAFLFSGQGSQYKNMGLELYQSEPMFRRVLERCQEGFGEAPEGSLLEVMYPATGTPSRLDETKFCQPALFALEVGLAKVWQSWGIEPDVVLGHSVGEYAAACIAGVFDIEEGAALIAARGRLMQSLPAGGKMTALFCDEATAREAIEGLADRVSIAAVNGPRNVVISGAGEAVDEVTARLEARDVRAQNLRVSHAFHSPLMPPILKDLEDVARRMTYRSPQIPMVSSVTGSPIGEDIATADYWVSQVCKPVLFADGMGELLDQKCEVFLEIGPGTTLLGMGRRCQPEGSTGDAVTVAPEATRWLPSLRPQRSDWQQLLSSLGGLFVGGVGVDWRGFDRAQARRKVTLPTYPFARERHWLEGLGQRAAGPQRSVELHPLVHRQLRSPALGAGTVVFESRLSADAPRYLNAHRIFGQVVIPGTAFLEMATVCARHLQGGDDVGVLDFALHRPMILRGSEPSAIQIVVEGGDELQQRTFRIFSELPEDDGSWQLHATGILAAVSSLAHTRRQAQPLGTSVAVGDYFQRAAAKGVEFGADFRALQKVWVEGELVSGEVELAPTLRPEAADYQLHPVLLDACFQSLGATLDAAGEDKVFLPVGVERLTLGGQLGEVRWSEAHLRPGSHEDLLVADFRLFDGAGTSVAQLEGVAFQKAAPESLLSTGSRREAVASYLYHQEWQEAEPARALSVSPAPYVLLADEGGVAQELAQRLESAGGTCYSVKPGTGFSRPTAREFLVHPEHPEDFRRLLAEVAADSGSAACQVVQLWTLSESGAGNLDGSNLDGKALCRAQTLGVAGTLHLVQALTEAAAGEAHRRLWLLTRGTQSVTDGETPELAQAPIWGLGRVIALEHPELTCVRLDLDSSEDQALGPILETLQRDDSEDQLAYRQGRLWVSRLARHRPTGAAEPSRSPAATNPGTNPGVAQRLRTKGGGILSNLTLDTVERRPPGPGEVEIAVQATGLNFKDVLLAMGAIPGQAGDGTLFGSECSGTICAVGDDVTHLTLGQDVVAVYAPGCLASHVTVDSSFVVPKPSGLSPHEAATAPVAFLTAMYGLRLVPLEPGMKVLIHAAAGGVGQAAVRLAQRAGAEVFATASQPKHGFLREAGVQHVMDSRSLDFADQILAATDGRGVDVVLNSFHGDYIPKNLDVLAEGGHFVEIGKVGIWSAAQVHARRPDVAYHPFDLSEQVFEQPEALQPLVTELMDLLERKELLPLPHAGFPMENVEEAFRHLAQGKNVGKVVLTQETEAQETEAPETSRVMPGVSVHGDGTWLITGGLGALGQRVARWLVEEGARHLILVSRRPPDAAARKAIDGLEELGVRVHTAEADVTREQDVSRVLGLCGDEMPALCGVVHAAGIVDDGVLRTQTWERVEKVLAPKVSGAFLLHTLTSNQPLEHFICFSSIASLFGSPGQGGYAAGNAFLDTLAHHRQALGLPALTINWGSWAETGMAATTSEQNQIGRLDDQIGLSALGPEDALAALGVLISGEAPQVGVFPMSWQRFWSSGNASFSKLSFFAGLGAPKREASASEGRFVRALTALPPERRLEELRDQVQAAIAAVLGLERKNVGPRQRLFDLGIDSLMALELRNRLQQGFGLRLPQTFVFDYPMLDAICDFLRAELSLDLSPPAESTPEAEDDLSLDGVGELSDADAETLLLQELENMNF